MNSGANRARQPRLCARPGCAAHAAVTLRFQPTLRQAWLVDLDETAARTQGDLCPRHATALVLPRGWELHDDRTERGPRRVAEPPAVPTTEPPRRRVRRSRRAAGTGVEPDPAPSQLPGLEPVVASNGHRAPEAPVEHPDEHGDDASDQLRMPRAVPAQFGANDADDVDLDDGELSEILDARTPLLRRAFRNAKPSE
jgi:hypothetical protein